MELQYLILGLLFACWTGSMNSQRTNATTSRVIGTTGTTISENTSFVDTGFNSTTLRLDSVRNSTTISQTANSTEDFGKQENYCTISSRNGTSHGGKFDRRVCRLTPVPAKEHVEKCCDYHYRLYKERWIVGSYYLVTILERMQRWGCQQFDIECINPTWQFNDYSRRVYDLFCRRSELEKSCFDDVNEAAQRYGFERNSSDKNWKNLIETLDSRRMEFKDLTKPCMQVALFDRKDGGPGRFHEVIEPFAPFCGLQWEGYDYNTAMNRAVTPWTGMSIWCKSSIIICVSVMALAGIITIFANILVLVVFAITPRMRNSQAVYKISLAAADLMVGLIVWPNMIGLQYLTFWTPRAMGRTINRPYCDNTDRTPYNNSNLTYRYGGGVFRDIFPTEYVRPMGFFSMLGLMVSIYTLMIASFDRFLAVFRPLRYNRFNAKRQAIIFSGVLWAISILVCLIPTFTPGFLYKVMSSILISLDGSAALVFIFIALLLPLIITWVITALTFHMSRQHARSRQKIVSSTTKSSEALERRLAKTLSIMVGAFTISVLPTICCTIAGFASSVTNWESPRNLILRAATAYTTSEYLAIIILTSNSMWNFFIYSLRAQGFRDVASQVIKRFLKRTGLTSIGRRAVQVLGGARRVSLSTLMNMRRFSTPDVSTDPRKKSVTSITGMSKMSDTDASSSGRHSSIFVSSTTDNSAASKYTKSGLKFSKTTSGVEIRAERKKALKKEESEEYVGDDSTFGSFAINAGADRLFESVMENVPEEIEIASTTAET